MHYSWGFPGVGMVAVGGAVHVDDVFSRVAVVLLDLAGGLFIVIAVAVALLHVGSSLHRTVSRTASRVAGVGAVPVSASAELPLEVPVVDVPAVTPAVVAVPRQRSADEPDAAGETRRPRTGAAYPAASAS